MKKKRPLMYSHELRKQNPYSMVDDIKILIRQVDEEEKRLEEFINQSTTEEELDRAVEWEKEIRAKIIALGIMSFAC